MKLTIGKRHSIAVKDLAAAQDHYRRLRDESGEGASTFPDGRVGNYRISYNGRIWLGDTAIVGAFASLAVPVREAAA